MSTYLAKMAVNQSKKYFNRSCVGKRNIFLLDSKLSLLVLKFSVSLHGNENPVFSNRWKIFLNVLFKFYTGGPCSSSLHSGH